MKEAQEKMRSGAAVQRWKMRRVGASIYIYIICINNMYMYIYIYIYIYGGFYKWGYPWVPKKMDGSKMENPSING